MNFKIKGKCHGCKQTKWFLMKRKVTLPIGVVATSKDLMCGTCAESLQGNIK